MAKQTMKFINSSNAEFALTYVKDVAGLGIPPIDLSTSRGFRQDGYTVSYVQYQARPFSIAMDIQESTYLLAATERRRLVAFFADKQPKTFSYTRGGVTYLLENVYLAGAYDTGIRERRTLEGVLQFIAGDPFFKVAKPAATLVDVIAAMEWDCEWLEAGIEYSTADSALMTVTYAGDVAAPLDIVFTGPATNPWLENVTTGERIEVTKVIEAGQTLTITGGYGQKRVTITLPSGVTQNGFHYIAAGSEFPTVQPGVNVIEYGADSQTAASTVTVDYDELYVGI